MSHPNDIQKDYEHSCIVLISYFCFSNVKMGNFSFFACLFANSHEFICYMLYVVKEYIALSADLEAMILGN